MESTYPTKQHQNPENTNLLCLETTNQYHSSCYCVTDFNNYICFISVITGISLSCVGARDNNMKLNTKRSWVWHSQSIMKKVMCPVWHTLCYIINSKNKMIKNGTNTSNYDDTNKLLTHVKNSDTITIQSYEQTAHT